LDWRAQGSESTDNLFTFIQGTAMAAEQSGHGLATGRVDEGGVDRQLVRRSLGEFPVEAEHLFGPPERVGHHPPKNRRADAVKLILERSDHPEIAEIGRA